MGDYRFLPTRANPQPAVTLYLRSPGEPSFRPHTLDVLRVEYGKVAEIADFTFLSPLLRVRAPGRAVVGARASIRPRRAAATRTIAAAPAGAPR